MPVVGEYKQGERGREAPKSLLEEKMIEASANIGAQESECVLRVTCVAWMRSSVFVPRGRSPPPLFIDARRGRVHVRGDLKSSFFPESGAHSGRIL